MTTNICLFMALAAAPFSAQADESKGHAERGTEVRGAQDKMMAPTHFIRIEDLEDKDIKLMASTESADGEPAYDLEMATAEAFLIAADGSIEWVVVSCDGHDTVVPADHLRWNQSEENFALGISKTDLASKPEFDLDQAREGGLHESLEVIEKSWNATKRKVAREASASKKPFTGTQYHVASDAVLCGDEIDELEVYGFEDEFGGVTKTFVDPVAMRIDLVVVSSGGLIGIGDTEYLIPFEALTVCREADEDMDDAELMLCLAKSADDLENAPEYMEPEDDDQLVSTANREEAIRFYCHPEKVSQY